MILKNSFFLFLQKKKKSFLAFNLFFSWYCKDEDDKSVSAYWLLKKKGFLFFFYKNLHFYKGTTGDCQRTEWPPKTVGWFFFFLVMVVLLLLLYTHIPVSFFTNTHTHVHHMNFFLRPGNIDHQAAQEKQLQRQKDNGWRGMWRARKEILKQMWERWGNSNEEIQWVCESGRGWKKKLENMR